MAKKIKERPILVINDVKIKKNETLITQDDMERSHDVMRQATKDDRPKGKEKHLQIKECKEVPISLTSLQNSIKRN